MNNKINDKKNDNLKIISGITATGKLTLGNYIGSIKKIKELQDENKGYELILFVADLHALTNYINPEIIKTNWKKIIKIYIACGIDPNKTMIFKQSEINGHTELFYYLLTITNMGQLKRMTQFKDKTQKMKNKTEIIPAGLLMYPILMAADIMLYDVDGVLVGNDQKQHLELTRDLITKFNKTYKLDFKIPKPFISSVEEGSRIMSLKNPNKKMSKSDENSDNVIYIIDEDEVIIKKINNSLTDDENKVYYDLEKKPGISNLIVIYSNLTNKDIKEVEEIFKDSNYGEFKREVANKIIEILSPIREKYKLITDNDVEYSLNINKEEIQKIAHKNLSKVEKAMGVK